jgi:CheY-like chemotaxis protein
MQWLTTSGARRPDLLFVDSNLPGMDGYTVVHAIKSNPGFAQTICILLSQGEGTVDRFKGKLAGIQSYMAKPFTVQVLLRVTRISLASIPAADPVL